MKAKWGLFMTEQKKNTIITSGIAVLAMIPVSYTHLPGVILEMSQSEVLWDIVRLISLKVLTYDDLSDFSDELQKEVKRILEMNR